MQLIITVSLTLWGQDTWGTGHQLNVPEGGFGNSVGKGDMGMQDRDLAKRYFFDLCEVVWSWLQDKGCDNNRSLCLSLSMKWASCEMRHLENGNLVFELVRRETKAKPFKLGW